MIKREAIIDFSNEIIWNNSNVYVGNSTIFYKTWLQLGIKYIKDIRGVFQKYAERYRRKFASAANLMIFHLRHA